MQTTTTISLPESLSKEMDREIKTGQFSSRSEFIRSAVRAYLTFQKGEISWEALAAPFRAYAKQTRLSKQDVLSAVEEGRHGKTSKNS